MKVVSLLLATTSVAIAQPALAQSEGAPPEKGGEKQVFSTGVAKGRDLLDSAISASTLDQAQIQKIGNHSVADILRNIPGLRVEGSSGDGNSNYTIRGLPMASGGSKYMQIEEDGLPVLEFGDFFGVASDIFIRPDINLSAVEAIRGGSASTFASNSPGGVINLISDTGEVEGGSVQLGTGVDFDEKRLDFAYGGKITDDVRFHVGGFYRSGEGPRHIGYNGFKGGQLKFNLTKEFTGGFVRLYGKYLDDRSPQYTPVPVKISGTNDKPNYDSFPNFDFIRDTLYSRNITGLVTLDGNNRLARYDAHDGMHAKSKSVGAEAKFDIAGWTVNERLRYSNNSGGVVRFLPSTLSTAGVVAESIGGTGATLRYASGPRAGQAITNPATLNGNGLLSSTLGIRYNINSLDNLTNDFRASRVWKAGGSDITTTFGVYKADQKLNTNWLYTNFVQDVVGDGNSALVDVLNARGVAQTQDGVNAYSLNGTSGLYRRTFDVDYDVTAPYGSLNYHSGRIAVGGSVRYDLGRVRGTLLGSDLGGGRNGLGSFDMNGDGTISPAETRVAFIPLTRPAPVHYNYHYLSYSAGVNYRLSEGLAVFARYSRGARANADKILFTSTVSTTDGSLDKPKDGYDVVKQSEAGVKFRHEDLSLNLTGFLANTNDTNLQSGGVSTQRKYRAYGAEFEGGYRHGPFVLNVGATYTHAEIKQDVTNAAVNGMTPRHQPKLIYTVTPQFETGLFTVGANVTGATSSYAGDVNVLKMPGYTLVDAFVQVRPMERVQLMVNAKNLFNTTALYEVNQNAVPANGVGYGRAATGRTISASARFDF